MKSFKQKMVVLAGLTGVSLIPLSAHAQDLTAIEAAFVQAGVDSSTVVGYAAAALVVLVASTWLIKGINSGR